MDDSEALISRNWRGEPSIAMKLAATGTSEFWAVVEYISTLHGVPDDYRRYQVADELVKLLVNTPMFNLDELYQQTFKSPITQVHRVVARLNGALTGLDKKDWWNGAREITEVTRSRYYELRNQWRSSRN